MELFKYNWNYEGHEQKKANVNNEKDLNEDGIRTILINIVNATKLKYKTERNYQGVNNNPFDMIVGDEDSLALMGLEIKGDTDNYTRLKAQLQAYLFVFDSVYLVLHKKEAPEWLPEYVGVLRVFEDGTACIEHSSSIREDTDISTDYEWDAIFRSNGLGITSKQTRDTLKIIKEVKRNILFNRFFAVSGGFNTKDFNKFYPFTDKQKAILMGFDMPYHYKEISKDINKIEERVNILRKIAMVGLKGIEEQVPLIR